MISNLPNFVNPNLFPMLLHPSPSTHTRTPLFLLQTMTKWVCQAILDSLTVFFLPLAAYRDAMTVWAERGYGDGLYLFGTTVYAGLIMAMMMKVFNMTNVRFHRR